MRRKGAHRTFETIKDVLITAQTDFKALTIVIPTHFTTDVVALSSTHKVLLHVDKLQTEEHGCSPVYIHEKLSALASCSLRFFDILTLRSFLRRSRLGSFGHVSTRHRLEHISLFVDRF